MIYFEVVVTMPLIINIDHIIVIVVIIIIIIVVVVVAAAAAILPLFNDLSFATCLKVI